MNTTQQSAMSINRDINLKDAVEHIKTSALRLSLDELALEIDQNKYTDDDIEGVLEDLRFVGLVEQKRTKKSGFTRILLKRPKHYRAVEIEREQRGVWGQDPNAPRYSVCVCNYNMSDTLDRAMSSVAGQLDEKLYEILVVDDGSSDESLDVLKKLAQKYPHFRYISLPRDSNRRLGETRNLSIRAARGEYVLIHIDADDEWEPYLQDIVTLFHRMEKAVGHDFLLAGQQTGIGKRDFLLAYGPYENVYRCEDRNMMMKLAKKNLLLFLDYRAYRTRLSRPTKKKIIKILRDVCSQMMYEMRQNELKASHITDILLAPIKGGQFSFSSRLLRAVLVLPIYVLSRFRPPIINHITWTELRDYHAARRGTYADVMARLGGDPDISFLSKEAQEIFSYDVKRPGFAGSK